MEDSLYLGNGDDFPKRIKDGNGKFHPPLVVDRQVAIGFPEVELFLQKRLYVGMLRDASSAIGDIEEPSFFQIMPVHAVKQPIIGKCLVMPVFGENTDDIILCCLRPNIIGAKTDERAVASVENTPKITMAVSAVFYVCLEDSRIHGSVDDGVVVKRGL